MLEAIAKKINILELSFQALLSGFLIKAKSAAACPRTNGIKDKIVFVVFDKSSQLCASINP